MPRVLDLDLDFFLNKLTVAQVGSVERKPDSCCRPWHPDEVRQFLEDRCGLRRNRKVPAGVGVHHHQAFHFWRFMIREAGIETPFDLVHVDAHADLGVMAQASDLLEKDVLHRDLEKRSDLPEGTGRMNPANYLLFAIACRWVKSLTYVTHPEWDGTDLPPSIFEGDNPLAIITVDEGARADKRKLSNVRLAVLEDYEKYRGHRERLAAIDGKKYLPPEQKFEYARSHGVIRLRADSPHPEGSGRGEPSVPFRTVFGPGFHEPTGWDCLFLSQSPAFTPKVSDELIPVILEYADIRWNQLG